MRNSRSRTAIGRYRSYRTAIEAIGAFQIVEDHVTATFHYRSYRRGHYRTIGEGTIGLSELSDYYRTTIGLLSESTIGTIGPGLRPVQWSQETEFPYMSGADTLLPARV